jgi:hypothetical protein
MHGGSIVASGEAVAAANSSEIRVAAKLVSSGSATVTVQDEQGKPLSDIPLAVGANYVTRSGVHSVGRTYRQTTDNDGKAVFDQLPLGDRLSTQVSVDSSFPIIGDLPEIALQKDGKREIIIVLDTSQARVLRVTASGRDSLPHNPACSITVVEGDGNGAWHRLTTQNIPGKANSVAFSVKSDYVLIVGQGGDCIFSESRWLVDRETSVNFDLTSVITVTGIVPSIARVTDEPAALYPYDAPPSLIWGATLGSSSLPSVKLDTKGMFTVQVPKGVSTKKWHVATRPGDVFTLTALSNTIDTSDVIEFESGQAATSRVEISMNVEGLQGATQVAVLVCPVYYEDWRYLEAELRFSLRIEADEKGNVPSRSLPLGRYVGILTYTDKNGVTRFGLSPGAYGTFEVKDGLITKVFLPVG